MANIGYARTYQAQSVLTASSGQLVLMLYDGALKFIGQAQDAFALGEDSPRRFETINRTIQRATAILAELQSNLNLEAGGDHAANLDRLYDYYQRRLLQANLRKEVDPLVEVERLLRSLRDGWAEMLRAEDGRRYAQGVA